VTCFLPDEFASLSAVNLEAVTPRGARWFLLVRMKTEAEQAMQLNTASVWAEETPGAAPNRRLPGNHWVFVFAALGMLVAVGGSLWAYLSGLRTLRALAAQIGDNTQAGSHATVSHLMENAQGWAMQIAAAAVAGGLALFLVAVLGSSFQRRRWIKQHAQLFEESELRTQKYLGQVANATVLGEEALKAKEEAERRLTEITNAHTLLQRELTERRQAEKSLAQQAQQLERSKDVLEMHVTARTQELQKLQRRNELILNSAGEGICGFDLEGKVTFANPAAAKATGWTVEQMIGKNEAHIFFAAGSKGYKDTPGFLKDDKGEYLPEQHFYRKDGTEFPVEYVRTPIKENNKTVGAVAMFKDITERRLSEDKLAHKAAELARSNAELEQFAFVASHDLQEPLRKIQAFGDRLKVKCDAVQLAEGRDYLERMQSAAARMQTLINDLLAFSRIIRSSQPFTNADLDAITREVLGDLEHRIEKTGARVEVGKLPAIEADPLQMRQLLQNLIGNALKFQAPGSVPVVKIDAQLVTRDQIREDAVFRNPPPTASSEDKFCVLTVQDNGIGFEEQYLEKIFAVFQRLHGRGEYEGTGVGLAVCRRITDRHGGLITAQSKPGEGSIFIVILPLRQPEAPETK
jgi:PAS domain S-box-containing protein